MVTQSLKGWKRPSVRLFAVALLIAAVGISLVVVGVTQLGGSSQGEQASDSLPQQGGGGGLNPTHEAALASLPTPASATKNGADVYSGNGTFSAYWIKDGSIQDIAGFYSDAAHKNGWAAVDATVAAVQGDKSQGGQKTAQTVESFTKDNLSLTVYLDENPDKGGSLGNIEAILRVQDR